MIEILIEYPFDEDYGDDIIITMIHDNKPVIEINFSEYNVIERKFIKYTTTYEKFRTYEIPSMKLYKYGWSLSCDHTLVGPVTECNIGGLWEVGMFGTKVNSEHDINFDNFGLVWVEMLEDYHQMKIDVKCLNSQK